MPKKNVTLFVDAELYDEAKAQGVAVSRVLEDILEDLIKNPSMSKEELDMRKRLRQQKQLMFQRDLLASDLEEIDDELREVGVEINDQQKLAVKAAKSQERGMAIKALNVLVMKSDYDEEVAWENESVEAILVELGNIDESPWDMEKFVSHVNKLRKLKRIMR